MTSTCMYIYILQNDKTQQNYKIFAIKKKEVLKIYIENINKQLIKNLNDTKISLVID